MSSNKEVRIGGSQRFIIQDVQTVFYQDEDKGFRIQLSKAESECVNSFYNVSCKYEDLAELIHIDS